MGRFSYPLSARRWIAGLLSGMPPFGALRLVGLAIIWPLLFTKIRQEPKNVIFCNNSKLQNHPDFGNTSPFECRYRFTCYSTILSPIANGCTPHITSFFVLKNRLITDSAFTYMTKWSSHAIFCHIFSSSGLGACFWDPIKDPKMTKEKLIWFLTKEPLKHV